jgi:glycopeptide antibiotics resistance protein
VRQSATKSEPPSILAIVLFVVYALLLVGIILFKFPFQYELTNSGRELNLIPFAGSFADHRGFGTGDIISNVLIFLPLGVYLSMFRSRWSFARRIVVVAATSVAFEAIQYAFGIGRSDITDVLCNTAGGLVGIGIYALSTRLLGIRTNRLLTIVALVVSVLALAFFTFLRLHSK